MSISIVKRIVSGGQTGVDRAALDFALAVEVECGGWVPKGRMAEDGVIPLRYPNLAETDSKESFVRTELNVRDADGTLLMTRGRLSGGSALTLDWAIRFGKPVLHIDLEQVPVEVAARRIRKWLSESRLAVLNVAGPRGSEDLEIYGLTRAVLAAVWGGPSI